MEQLKQTVAAQNAQPGYEEQVALLEKSYELAAKYMPGNGGKGWTAARRMKKPDGMET